MCIYGEQRQFRQFNRPSIYRCFSILTCFQNKANCSFRTCLYACTPMPATTLHFSLVDLLWGHFSSSLLWETHFELSLRFPVILPCLEASKMVGILFYFSEFSNGDEKSYFTTFLPSQSSDWDIALFSCGDRLPHPTGDHFGEGRGQIFLLSNISHSFPTRGRSDSLVSWNLYIPDNDDISVGPIPLTLSLRSLFMGCTSPMMRENSTHTFLTGLPLFFITTWDPSQSDLILSMSRGFQFHWPHSNGACQDLQGIVNLSSWMVLIGTALGFQNHACHACHLPSLKTAELLIRSR